MRKHLAVLILALPLLDGGCATVVNGTKQNVVFDSSPNGAKVELTGGQTCTTPCKIKVKRKYDLRADFTHDGYQPAHVLVQSRLSGATAGNLILGGLIGGVVDGSNGASNRLSPNPVNVQLVALGAQGDAMLLDKSGKPNQSVREHNDSVKADVAKTIGAAAAELGSGSPTSAAPAPAQPAH